jgi:hypothetical protein
MGGGLQCMWMDCKNPWEECALEGWVVRLGIL